MKMNTEAGVDAGTGADAGAGARADAGAVAEGVADTGVGAGTSTEEVARVGEHGERAREVGRRGALTTTLAGKKKEE